MSNNSHGPGSPVESSGHSIGVYSRQSRRSRSDSLHYSDSFDSEDSGQDTRQVTPAVRKSRGNEQSGSNRRVTQNSTKSYSSASTNAGKNTKKKTGPRKGTGTKSLGNSTSRTMSITSTQQSPRSTNEVHQRMLSAKGHTIRRLRNEMEEVRMKYEEVLSENRLMKQVQRRQERALSKFQNDEAELPQLLKKHSAELDSLNRRIRRYQQKEKESDRRAKDQHEQLLRAKDELRRLQDLAADRGLKDRDQLRRRADQLEEGMEEKNSRIGDLEKYIENMKKNHRRAEHQWRVKELDIKNRLREAETERDQLKYKLREREKELDVRNIYSNRFAKFTPRLRSMSESNPLSLSVTKSASVEDLRDPLSPRSDVKQDLKRSPSLDDDPPRTGKFSPSGDNNHGMMNAGLSETDRQMVAESGKDTSARRSVSLETGERSVKQTEAKDSSEVERADHESGSKDPPKRVAPKRQDTFDKEKEEAPVVEDEHLKILRMLDADVQSLESKRTVPKAAEKPAEPDKKGKVFGSTENSTYKPTWLFGNNAKEEPNQDVKKPKQLTKDPASLGEDRSKTEEENFPFFGSTRPTAEQSAAKSEQPSEGVVNSVRDLHKYSRADETKKNGIVFNPQWKSEIGDDKPKPAAAQNDDYQRKKELLLERMWATDDHQKPDNRTGSGKSPREYGFTRPVENLHHGRPSHPELNLSPKSLKKPGSTGNNGPRRKSKENIDVDEVSFDSYAPSFSKQTDAKVKPKQGLNGSRFVESKERDERSSFGESIFSTTTKAKPVSDGGGLPWETTSRTPQSRTAVNANGKQGTLFATMPYSQQKGPFAAKPITAAGNDDLDDDLEEFVL